MEKKIKTENGTWKVPRSRDIMYNFSQETSFHGLRQIGEKQPFAVRRLLWVILFIGGVSIFIVQMSMSIKYYLNWPVTVDVKINYNDSIIFPAVTICNSNAFSATIAYERGYYFLIDDLFGPEGYMDVEKYNSSWLSLAGLYEAIGHSKSDMIVSCRWKGHECSAHDFVAVMTDYGRCFTFNSGKKNTPLKETRKPGSDGGLRVKLNIEQYKYMHGPNDGAGLKILVHNHKDVPLVRDHGLAVPPGSQAFVGVKIVEVNNLEPEYGKCNDSGKHSQRSTYTISRCNANCKMMYLQQQCGCKDIYMEDLAERTKVCSLETYQTCVRDALKSYNVMSDLCTCPIPCHQLLYESTISYSSTSNFDIDAFLRNATSGILEEAHVFGREISQRVNKDIYEDNVDVTNQLNETVETLSQAFVTIQKEAINLSNTIQQSYDVLNNRVKFHLDRGLEAVEYTIRHDFVRGFEVFDERAFHHAVFDFMGFPVTLKRTWDRASARMALNDTTSRELVILPVLDMFAARSTLLVRAAEFLDSVNDAYLTGKPLQTFRLTYERRYDMAYIHVPLLQIEGSKQQHNYDESIEAIDRMHLGLDVLQNISEETIKTGIFNESLFTYGEERYISGGRQFNYRMYMLKTRIIETPLEEIRKRIEQFQIANLNLQENVQSTLNKLSQLITLLGTIRDGTWKNIVSVSKLSSKYITDWDILKTPISHIVTSRTIEDSVRAASTNFNDIRLRVSVLQDDILNLKAAFETIWTLMLSEDSVKEPYRMMYEDCQDFVENDDNDDLYIQVFAYMLRVSTDEIRNLSHGEIISRMNCDFHVLNISMALNATAVQFEEMQDAIDLARHIGEADEIFLEIFRTFSEEHQNFISDNKIDSEFYRENFLTLEVFMQELSYEEITQQKAYDITQLLSDIGGSMGLFIGGSMLSVFEFFEVIIHRGLRVALNR